MVEDLEGCVRWAYIPMHLIAFLVDVSNVNVFVETFFCSAASGGRSNENSL